MRWTVLLLLALTSTAGCLDEEADPALDDQAVDETPTEVPEPLHFEGSLRGVGSGAGVEPLCYLEDQQCEVHSFTIDARYKVTITLEGTNGPVGDGSGGLVTSSDYDLYVWDADGNAIGESTNPSGSPDVVEATLDAGTYDMLVQAWNDLDGSYTLDIVFA